MLTLSQVIYGVQDLEAATKQLEARGFTVVDGRYHPGLGTANRIIPLEDAYFEILYSLDNLYLPTQFLCIYFSFNNMAIQNSIIKPGMLLPIQYYVFNNSNICKSAYIARPKETHAQLFTHKII